MNIESFREYCLSLPLATEDMPFDDQVLVFRLHGKIFACVSMDRPDIASMKCDPELAIELRERYQAVEGAYHWNKKYWNQVWFDRDATDEQIREWVRHAYDEVWKKLPKKLRGDK